MKTIAVTINWVDVRDELPDDELRVLVAFEDGEVDAADGEGVGRRQHETHQAFVLRRRFRGASHPRLSIMFIM